MATSRDYNELKYAWKGWYEAAGRPIKNDYKDFVELSNIASMADGDLLFFMLFLFEYVCYYTEQKRFQFIGIFRSSRDLNICCFLELFCIKTKV